MKKRINLNLQMFAGEAGGEGGEQGGEQAGTQQEILYGKQPGEELTEEGRETEEEKPDPKEEFEKFRNEHKEQFDEYIRGENQKSRAELKKLQGQVQQFQTIMDMLKNRYGVSEIKDLEAAIDEDYGYYEKEAAEKGMTVEQLKYVKEIERQNERYRQKEKIQEINTQWAAQEQEAKAKFPEFDFAKEMQNEKFADLAFRGIDLKTAYEVIHMDDLMMGAMQKTAENVRKTTVDNIRARNARPAENGTYKQPGAVVKRDVNKLSGSDIRNIIKRVQNGEHIEF